MAQKSPRVSDDFGRPMKKHTGFTLVEVLIAMIVLAVGLLGLAGLQATSLKNNQSAYNRIKATQLAYDIADRMRANYTEAKKPGNVYVATTTPPNSAVASCGNTTGCTPAQMAQNDLYEWNQAIDITTNPSGGLPGGTGTIVITGALGNVVTITINWVENRDENNDGASDVSSFLMSFQI